MRICIYVFLQYTLQDYIIYMTYTINKSMYFIYKIKKIKKGVEEVVQQLRRLTAFAEDSGLFPKIYNDDS